MKKQLIMEKALELFAKQGFEATSVQQITEHCGISKGAFYLSFKSKDELILALIDYFMNQMTSDIDYVVRNTNMEELLYKFYFTIFQTSYQHSDFARLLMKEQSHTFNNDLLVKMHYYDRLLDHTILYMVDQLYGKAVTETKYDLVYCIKGFIHTYSHLIFFYHVPLNLELLSQSLVEKTNLLAQHTTIPFISEELIQTFKSPVNEEITKEQILEIVEQKMEEMEESVEKESLLLLKEQLVEPTFRPVIIKGLIENIRNHPHCKWISFLLRRFYNF
ncbi:TetR family transcriptional regulator [Neobacillus bataviensis]|uniref:TetR family transcriptional regulator n=1 Tax=Neobacillus bataviensis TaxID=220685 RepID=A0A561DCG9_9BACI|nr:TetR/AcrR family transcriptional regulator [Neobacillus bataviensis]TWE01085.1 TetR family transcriptional regulator [Neobacillus bataviensis]